MNLSERLQEHCCDCGNPIPMYVIEEIKELEKMIDILASRMHITDKQTGKTEEAGKCGMSDFIIKLTRAEARNR
jgi:hypothetical protein